MSRTFLLIEYLPSKVAKFSYVFRCALANIFQIRADLIVALALWKRFLGISSSVFEIGAEVQSSSGLMFICVKPTQVIVEFTLTNC